MPSEICTDDRFEQTEKVKKKLLEATNIANDEKEMAVIDSILFRFWQLGWLDKINEEIIHCPECCHYTPPVCDLYPERYMTSRDGYCYHAEPVGTPRCKDCQNYFRCELYIDENSTFAKRCALFTKKEKVKIGWDGDKNEKR